MTELTKMGDNASVPLRFYLFDGENTTLIKTDNLRALEEGATMPRSRRKNYLKHLKPR